jgi:hypothetical protein
VPNVFLAAGVIALAGALLAVNNSSLRVFDPVANASGDPRLGSFLAQPAVPKGWTATYETEYLSNKPLFGQSSRWFRYLLSPVSPGLTDLRTSIPVTADVINAGGLSGFGQYGVAACYSFHGYTLRDVASVSLADGITGQALSFSGSTTHQDWSLVWWVWPVKTQTGTRYERVILYLQNTADQLVTVTGHYAQVVGLKGALSSSDPVQRRLLTNRGFLVAFAREIIQGQAGQTDTTVNIAALAPGRATVPSGGSGHFLEHYLSRHPRITKHLQ